MSSAVDQKPVRILPDSALGLALLDAAEGGRMIVVDIGETRYEIEVHVAQPEMAETDWIPERVARSIEAIRKATGSWQGVVDVEAFQTYVYERRRTANRPSVEL